MTDLVSSRLIVLVSVKIDPPTCPMYKYLYHICHRTNMSKIWCFDSEGKTEKRVYLQIFVLRMVDIIMSFAPPCNAE